MRRIVVVPYDPAWVAEYEKASAAVAGALEENVVAVHHIGSTSIPGMWAKPIIDMLVEVEAIAAVDERNGAMAALGYEAMGEFGIAGRRYFRRDDAAGMRTHHVHVFARGSADVERHLAFRDYLRAHPEEAGRYAALKRELARVFADNAEAYMDGKDPFLKEMERKASAWWVGRASESA